MILSLSSSSCVQVEYFFIYCFLYLNDFSWLENNLNNCCFCECELIFVQISFLFSNCLHVKIWALLFNPDL